jgi:hypothetical protein
MLIVRENIDVDDDPLGNICEISPLPSECSNGKGCIISAIEDMVKLPFARPEFYCNLIGSRPLK